MKIAQIAPLIERVPPKKYGGTERVVWALTEELVKLGHEVQLFASGDSQTSAKLNSVYYKSLREARLKDIYGANAWTLLNVGLAFDRQNEFDIIHDHSGIISLPTANIAKTPTVMTYHGSFSSREKKLFNSLRKPFLTAISNSQAQSAPELHFAGTVYNGLPMQDYPFTPTSKDYLLCVGRTSMEKGIQYAIEAAQYLGMPLIIAAKVDEADQSFFRHNIEPFLSDQIQFIGEVDMETRNHLMSEALCFLHPVIWREPFGLTLIEAGACGCPVVAFNKGAIPEIIVHEKTGYVVQDVVEMIDAILNIDKIDRNLCRNYVLEKFNSEKMAKEYERIYREILEGKII